MFHAIRMKSWRDARIFADSLDQNWVFRGQADATWPLTTKLQREGERHRRDRDQWLYLERLMLREFQRGAQHYLSDLPADDNYIEWLAMMQHYGAPTRLLDFTRSFYVAAFFAMEAKPSKGTEEAAVWAINCNVLDARAKANKIDGLETRLDGEQRRKRVNEFVARNFAESENPPFVLAVEPHRVDPRLMAQQGVFMLPCRIGASFYDNLSGTLGLERVDAIDAVKPDDFSEDLIRQYQGEDVDTLRIHLPYSAPWPDIQAQYSEAYTIMRDLKKMNITPQTLFPGVDGFGRSMAYYLRHYNEAPQT